MQNNVQWIHTGIVFNPLNRIDFQSLKEKGLEEEKIDDDEPLYYITVMGPQDLTLGPSFVYVYDIQPDSLSYYYTQPRDKQRIFRLKKDFEKKINTQKGTNMIKTRLGRALYKVLKDKKTWSYEDKPPIFFTESYVYTDSITGIEERGFAEFTKGTTLISNDQPIENPPEMTGVFIGFGNVFWTSHKPATDEIISQLKGDMKPNLLAL